MTTLLLALVATNPAFAFGRATGGTTSTSGTAAATGAATGGSPAGAYPNAADLFATSSDPSRWSKDFGSKPVMCGGVVKPLGTCYDLHYDAVLAPNRWVCIDPVGGNKEWDELERKCSSDIAAVGAHNKLVGAGYSADKRIDALWANDLCLDLVLGKSLSEGYSGTYDVATVATTLTLKGAAEPFVCGTYSRIAGLETGKANRTEVVLTSTYLADRTADGEEDDTRDGRIGTLETQVDILNQAVTITEVPCPEDSEPGTKCHAAKRIDAIETKAAATDAEVTKIGAVVEKLVKHWVPVYGGGAGYITEMGFSGPTATGFVGGENRWFRIEAEADISALNPDSAIGFAGGMALYFKPVNFFAIGGEVGGQTISIGPRDEDRMEEGESGGTFYGLVGTAWVPIPKSGLTGGVRVHGGWVSGTHLNTVDYTAQPDLAGFRGLFSLVIQGGGHSGVTYTAPEE